MESIHPVQDEEKLQSLIKTIEQDGWIGAPLVHDGNILITGVHRYAAVKELGWIDYEIPTIEITEVFDEAGLDYDELWQQEGEPTVDEPAYVYLLEALPTEISDKYGIDLH